MAILNINHDNFNTNLCDGLQSILASSEMSDVTLAVEGKYIKAHQLILSMCSTYFRDLFSVTPSRNTIFFMKNVKHRIMQNLLLFVYEGKVQIPSEDIQLFMDTANELKIKGLTTDMHSKAAEVSRGQVHTADNTEHAIDAASSLKRAAEPMKEKAKKHKPNNNEPDQSIQGSDDEIIKLEEIGDKEDNTMTIEKCLPPPPQGIPVTVSLCMLGKKVTGVIWDGFRYGQKSECGQYSQWRCTAQSHLKCQARLFWSVEKSMITVNQSHTHDKRHILNHSVTCKPHTLYALSIEQFRQRFMAKKS